MSNKRISDYTSAGALTGAELVELVQSGNSVSGLLSVVRAWILADGFADNETPAGTINGTDGTDGNAVFTLAAAPSPAASLQLFKTDVGTAPLMVAGTHYNLSGLTITYTTGNIPTVGMTHRAFYRK